VEHATRGHTVVEVDLNGPSRRLMFTHLGSLTERHGMCMYRHQPLSIESDSDRVSITVPRAHDQREAEGIVASFVESTRTWLRPKLG
jgi:hypothetical protein